MKTPYDTPEEQQIMEHLAQAWNLLLKLPKTHPSHLKDFADGVHMCQNVIIHRIVQRDYPDMFPSYEEW